MKAKDDYPWKKRRGESRRRSCSRSLTVLELLSAAGQNAAGQHSRRGQALQR